MTLEDQTHDLSRRLQELSNQHREYAIMDSFDTHVSSEELARQLTVAMGELGEDERYAGLAALITSAREGDACYKDLAPLGQALTLAAQSQTGFTDAVGLNESVRYLLAHNEYTPIRATNEYDFFVNEERSIVLALGKNGEVYAVRPKSKQKIDECVNDFENVKSMTTAEVKSFDTMDPPKGNIFGGISSIFGFSIDASAMMYYSSRVSEVGWDLARDTLQHHFQPNYEVPLPVTALTIGTTLLVGGVVLAYQGMKKRNKEVKEAKAKVPFQSVHSGIDALVAAFPLAENPARITDDDEAKITSTDKARIVDAEAQIVESTPKPNQQTLAQNT